MKKLKIVAIISGILTFLQLLPAIIVSVILPIKFKLSETGAGAIGIIGGADGPTSIYVAGMFPTFVAVARYVFFAACVLTFVVSLVLLIRNRNKNKG